MSRYSSGRFPSRFFTPYVPHASPIQFSLIVITRMFGKNQNLWTSSWRHLPWSPLYFTKYPPRQPNRGQPELVFVPHRPRYKKPPRLHTLRLLSSVHAEEVQLSKGPLRRNTNLFPKRNVTVMSTEAVRDEPCSSVAPEWRHRTSAQQPYHEHRISAGRDFPRPSEPALGPTHRPIHWIAAPFPWGKQAGRGVNNPPTCSAEVKERVELYLYSLSVPSWSVLGRTLPCL
jgi:hypothetical protein